MTALPEHARAAAARRLALTSTGNHAIDRLCELAAALLEVASAQVSLISDVQLVVGGAGAGSTAVGKETDADDSLCTVTVRAAEPLVVPDAGDDARVSSLPPVASGAVGSYLGVPLLDEDGHVVGALCAYDRAVHAWTERDVTTLQRLAGSVLAELELAALSSDYETGQLRWRLAADAAGVGAFDWHIPTDELSWDDRLLDLFGLDRVTFGGDLESFNRSLHPEDVARVSVAIQQAIDSCGEYSAEYRVVLPSGDVRWVAARGRVLCGEDGVATRLIGAAYDTTAVREGDARLARVLESMPSAFVQLDRSWSIQYLNAEAERLLGRNRSDLIGRDMWEAYPDTVGSEIEKHYRQAIEEGRPVTFDTYYPEPLDGWYEIRAWPTPDGLSIYFLEVTARREAQEQLTHAARRDALLAHVTEQLTDTLDLGEAVARLGALVVPELGEWCVATTVGDRGPSGRPPILHDIGAWHAEPALQPAAARFAAIRLGAMSDDSFLPAVLSSESPQTTDDASAALRQLFDSPEVHELIDTLSPQHAAVVNLRGRDRVVGLLTIFRPACVGAFSDDDLELLSAVAARAGLALDNVRLFAEQRELAEGLQRSLLTEPPQPDDLEIVVRYEAAAEAARVGGDWYDAFLQPQGATVLVVGDVVGHDTAAAAAMGQLRSLLRGIAVFGGDSPAEVLRGVDRTLQTLQVDTTATAIVARLEQTPEERATGVTRLRWSNAGHPPPVILEPGGRARLLGAETHDLLLGLDPQADRREGVVTLARGATVLLFTDGLVERRGEALEAGLDRILEALARLDRVHPELEDLCDALLAEMVPGRREDDLALVAVRLHPQDR